MPSQPADKSSDALLEIDRPRPGETHQQHVERLFREHNRSLIRILQARLHSWEEAKEVAQEAYVKMLGLDRPDLVIFLRRYLFRTAVNLATNRLKQRAQRERDNELLFWEEEQDSRSPERLLEARREVELIRSALADLPPNCREAFELVRVDGLSSEEAGERLGLHPRRVRRFVVRAMAHITQVMMSEPTNQDPP